MTAFCVQSVDHCKRLVTENEGKLYEIRFSLYLCIIYFKNCEVQKVNVVIQACPVCLVLWDHQDYKVRYL